MKLAILEAPIKGSICLGQHRMCTSATPSCEKREEEGTEMGVQGDDGNARA